MDKNNTIFAFDELHIPIIIRDVIVNSWIIILAVLAVCMNIFTYVNILHKPQYTSEATFVVSPRSNGSYVGFYASLTTANEMAEVFSEVFTSDVLKRKIREDLNEPNINFTINAYVAQETNVLCVNAVADSPEQAHSVMLSLIKNYGEVSTYLFGGVVLDPLKTPQITTTPSNPPDIKMMLILGCSLAAISTTGLIVLLSIFRKTIKTRACAKRRMGERPLGVLIKADKRKINKKNKKTALLITNLVIGFRYVETMLQITHKIGHKMHKNGHKVLLVTSAAENEGKSTIATNIALFMEKHGYSVALVDFDMRRPSIRKILSEHPYNVHDLSECLQNGKPGDIKAEKGKLEIFGCNKPLRHPDRMLNSDKLQSFISELRKKVDYVIIDSAPFTVAADTGMILQYSDAALLVIRQDWVPYNILQSVAEELDSGHAEYLGYILNNHRRNSFSHHV